MEPLYAAGCRDYPDYNECALFIKLATFTPAQGILTFTVICGFLNHYVFCSSRLRTIYGPKYLALARDEQRRVGVLHVGIVMKVTAFCLLATPLYFIQLRNHTWLDPGPIPCLTLAEMAAGAIASFAALSLFDLIYSDNIKLVYVLHHLGLPPVALQGLFVLQALFTATKVKTAQRIWAVCQRQAQASLLKHRKCSPTMREKVEAGCSLCK
ncbi:uncharacterized protein BO87DRAFT_430834 [Aspergillus neoniger CBS 115656]|uniref:Uncharacterized protein n=1 Tax=Aspergillus neoniger (strain CBS 115656) TaxID=1448310 RepID=A0A318Y6L1_ASPNB|nr:hypothetical protein BO87DRAFT_430834 [Aspergillus neoniger CBS 115656]PYH29167.1 hypothetical protein BO87DRAFT_430834 [Aspergillus neoniger CBS 115656]